MILDTGLSYETAYPILRKYGVEKYWTDVFLSHQDIDHYKYYNQFKNRANREFSKIRLERYPLRHGAKISYAHIIEYGKYKIFWATDFDEISLELQNKMRGMHFDLVLIEANYSEEYINTEEAELTKFRSDQHHSLEDTLKFLKTFTWDRVHLIHLSVVNLPIEKLSNLPKNVTYTQPYSKICDEMMYVHRNELQIKILDKIKHAKPRGYHA